MAIKSRVSALESRLGLDERDDRLHREYREYIGRGEEAPFALRQRMFAVIAKRGNLAELMPKSPRDAERAGPVRTREEHKRTMSRTKWKPGQSGNPKGRPPGTGEIGQLRDAIRVHVPDMIAAMVKAAKHGDAQAARLLLERVIPPLKGAELPIVLALGATDLTGTGEAILRAVQRGELAPGQASQLIQGIAALARVKELDELERRLSALEQRTTERRSEQ